MLDQHIISFFNLVGFVLSMSSVTIVARTSSLLTGKLRSGMLSFLWGLAIISASFIWAFASRWLSYDMPDLRPIILSLGMMLLLISVNRLFGIYRASGVGL